MKLFYLAICIALFSVTNLNAKNNLEKQNAAILDIELIDPGCWSIAVTVYHGTINRGLSRDEAVDLAAWVYNDCVSW